MVDSELVVRPFRGVSAADRLRGRRDALLEAGLDAVAEGALASVTVEEVSARAGLSKRYFYEHFRTRNDLFVALADGLVEQLASAVTQSAQDPEFDIATSLRGVVEAVMSVLLEDPRHARLFVEVIGGEQLGNTVRSAEHLIASAMIDVIVGGRTVTPKQRTRANLAALILVTGAAQAVGDWLSGRIDLSRTELLDEISNLGAAAIDAILPDS